MQHYISVSIYGLMLAWITSENSIKQLECPHLDSIFFAEPYLLLLCPESTASLRVVSPTTCQLLCPVSTAPVRGSTPTACQLLSPTNSLSCPLTTSGYGEISGPKTLCLVSRQNRQRIVCLAGHLYSVTLIQIDCLLRLFSNHEVDTFYLMSKRLLVGGMNIFVKSGKLRCCIAT